MKLCKLTIQLLFRTVEICSGWRVQCKDEMLKFLRSLPNLQSFFHERFFTSVQVMDLPLLTDSVRNAPLRNLHLKVESDCTLGSQPVKAPQHLDKLMVNWAVTDYIPHRGSSIEILYSFIQPSLSNLVELELILSSEVQATRLEFDIRLLSPARHTLRIFRLEIIAADTEILETIPEVLPELTELSLKFYGYNPLSLTVWKVRLLPDDAFPSFKCHVNEWVG
jgi:hypothetical protein